jgi:deoxyribodipyrimidine photo-lyase
MKSLFWFWDQYRLHDHKILDHALEHSSEIAFIVVKDPREWEGVTERHKFPKIGNVRKAWIEGCFCDLAASLEAKGHKLYCIEGNPEVEIPALMENEGFSRLYAPVLPGIGARTTLRALERALATKGLDCVSEEESTLVTREDLPFKVDSDLPVFFSDYRKLIEDDLKVRLEVKPFNGKWPTPVTLDYTEIFADDSLEKGFFVTSEYPWSPGESGALRRLQEYLWDTRSLSHFKETRDQLMGWDQSSHFSPWLARGCLSPRRIYWEVRKFEATFKTSESSYGMIFQLLWRDYFRWVESRYSQKIREVGGVQEKLPTHDPVPSDILHAWRAGKSGDSLIDACMRELLRTGWLTQKGRQNSASFLIHDLHGDWTFGAEWFESQLMDYDAATNWVSWMNIAGVGIGPTPLRKFDLKVQADRYDASGEYRKKWGAS